MGWKDFLFGKDESYEQKDLLGKEARQKLNNYFSNPIEKSPLYGAGSDYLQKLLSNDPEAYKDFERPYIENFEQNVMPRIAERYGSVGTGAGGYNSSALTQAMAQAGKSLQTDLAAQRANLQQNSLPQALQYAQQPYSNTLQGAQVDQNSRQM